MSCRSSRSRGLAMRARRTAARSMRCSTRHSSLPAGSSSSRPSGPDRARAAPEADAVLEADAVAVQQVGGEQLRVGAGHGVVAARGPERVAVHHPAARRRGRADEQLHPLRGPAAPAAVGCHMSSQISMPACHGRGGAAAASGRGEGAKPVPLGQVPGLVEETVGGQVHLAVDVVERGRRRSTARRCRSGRRRSPARSRRPRRPPRDAAASRSTRLATARAPPRRGPGP